MLFGEKQIPSPASWVGKLGYFQVVPPGTEFSTTPAGAPRDTILKVLNQSIFCHPDRGGHGPAAHPRR